MPTFNHHMMVLAREARGLTQAELAQQLKAAQGTVSKYETGFQVPPDEFVDDLSNTLGFPRPFFLNRVFLTVCRHFIIGGVKNYPRRRWEKLSLK